MTQVWGATTLGSRVSQSSNCEYRYSPVGPCERIKAAASALVSFRPRFAAAPLAITSGKSWLRMTCHANGSFFTLKKSPPLGQSMNPIATTVMRSETDGSLRIADATSVPAPMAKTMRRRDLEKSLERRSSKSTPAFSRGVFASWSGSEDPATTGRDEARAGKTCRITSAAFSALRADDKRMDDACVVMTACKSRFVLNKRCASAHWSSVSAPQSVVKIAAGAAVVDFALIAASGVITSSAPVIISVTAIGVFIGFWIVVEVQWRVERPNK